MNGAEMSGDRTETWLLAYRRVRKTAIGSTMRENRRRLVRVGANRCLGGRWLDLGAGDGNVVPCLAEQGASQVVAIDYQFELIRHASPSADRIAGSADRLPLQPESMDGVIVMDVFHHLQPSSLVPAIGEIHRVLRPGGALFVFEPAGTRVRRILTVALMSRLGSVSTFTRDKRSMVQSEAATLEPWLEAERGVPELMASAGFVMELETRGLLHLAWRFRRTAVTTSKGKL